jgi:hypothetical protein
MPINNLPLLQVTEGFTIPLDVTVNKTGGMKINSGRNDSNFLKIKWFVQMWNVGSHMHLEENERMPQHLRPQTRCDIPLPKERKKKASAPAKRQRKQ